MCLQCRFTDLYEYMCHITLIINKGMCQLPLGNQESRASRWVLRMGISIAVQTSLLPIKGVLPSLYRWWWWWWCGGSQQQHSHSKYSKKGKLDSAQWSKEGTRRTLPLPCCAHAYCASPVPTEIISASASYNSPNARGVRRNLQILTSSETRRIAVNDRFHREPAWDLLTSWIRIKCVCFFLTACHWWSRCDCRNRSADDPTRMSAISMHFTVNGEFR